MQYLLTELLAMPMDSHLMSRGKYHCSSKESHYQLLENIFPITTSGHVRVEGVNPPQKTNY